MEKYFNDAVIGNREMTVSFTKNGELQRLFYPATDYKQFIDFFHTGVKVNDSCMIYLHKDINNIYKQYYIPDTNILNTEIFNTYFHLNIIQTDFVPIKENLLIKQYKFINKNTIDLDINFLIHSKLLSNDNNQTSGYYKNNALIQYNHDDTLAILSDEKIMTSQINNNVNNIEDGVIGDKDYIGMSQDSSICYNLGILKPGQEKEINIIVYVSENKGKNHLNELEKIRKIDVQKNYEETKKYWRKYLKEHNTLEIEEKNEYEKKVKSIYKRTILLYPLLTNSNSGGISAAVEVDEKRTKCGRYSYCWPRDAIFITKAMDILGMQKETDKFYKNFCKNTQSKEGMWEQRFYTDGNLAPSWGYQIDETASVVYGVCEHFKYAKDKKFLKETLKMCEKAIHYLKKYIEKVLAGEEQEYKSYDIWEETEGIHTYSLASIYAAFESMLYIYEKIKPEYQENRLKIEQITKETTQLQQYIREIKGYVLRKLYDENKKSFIRNENDRKMDISLIGLTTPFKMFEPKEKKMINTIERINLTLRTYTGGYLRYENDNYIGGNPWVISNLWLAQYYLETGRKKEAQECFKYVVNSATEHGFLGEQVDNKTMQPAWVIGLRLVTCNVYYFIRKI